MMLINATRAMKELLDLGGESAVQYMCVTILLSVLHISRTEHHSSCCDESSLALEFYVVFQQITSLRTGKPQPRSSSAIIESPLLLQHQQLRAGKGFE